MGNPNHDAEVVWLCVIEVWYYVMFEMFQSVEHDDSALKYAQVIKDDKLVVLR